MINNDDGFGQENRRVIVLLVVVAEAAGRLLHLVQLHAGVRLLQADALLVARVLLPGSTLQGPAAGLSGAGPGKVGSSLN